MTNEIILNQIQEQLSSKFSKDDIKEILHVLSDYSIEENDKDAAGGAEGYSIPKEIPHFILAKKIEGKSPATLKNYELYLTNLFLELRIPVNEVTTDHIRNYLYNYQAERQIQNSSLETMRITFNSFFSWCQANHFVSSNPVELISPIKYHQKPKEGMTQLELEMMRAAADTARDKAIVEFLYSTGCRVSEVAHLHRSDIDFVDKSCIVKGKGGKYRKVYINAKAELTLKQYFESRKDGNDFLFCALRSPWSQLTKSGIESVIRKLKNKSGVTKNVTPHIFRYTMATDALQSGMDVTEVQRLLGHANVSTTMIYAKVDDEILHNKFKKIIRQKEIERMRGRRLRDLLNGDAASPFAQLN